MDQRHSPLCPVCHSPLPAGRLEGLCPGCVLGLFDDIPEEDGLFPLPGHKVIEELARGGMGIVYKARQMEPSRDVAVKMLLPHLLDEAPMKERFRREAGAMAALDHPAILPVYHVGEYEGLPWFTMRLATGGTLHARRASFTGKWREASVLVSRLADAVHYAHSHGVLHRDIKPGNVLFDNAERPFLADFGLAKRLDIDDQRRSGPSVTRTASFFGTPHYLAPEIAAGSATSATTASDIYSLGAILYELLAQQPPFSAENIPALLRKIADEDPRPLPSDVPKELAAITLKCLSKERHLRYDTAGDLHDDLKAWLEGRPVQARPPGRGERLMRWARRNPGQASLASALVVSLVTGAALLAQKNRSLAQALFSAQSATAAAESAKSLAETAQRSAREQLRQSLLAQAHARRLAGGIGQREEVLQTLIKASEVKPGADIKEEAVAALAMPDLKLARTLNLPAYHSSGRVGFTRNLNRVALASEGGGVEVRSMQDQTVVWASTPFADDPPLTFDFSPGGALLITTHAGGSARLWRATDGKLVRDWQPAEPGVRVITAFRDSHEPGVPPACAVAGIADGLVIFDPVNEKEGIVLEAAGAPITALAFSPTGQRLAVGRSNAIELWDVLDEQLLWQVTQARVMPSMAWAPEGEALAFATMADSDIILMDAETGNERLRFRGHLEPAIALDYSPAGRWLASTSTDGSVRLWDVISGRRWLTAPAIARAVCFSHDGERLASARGTDELAEWQIRPPVGFVEYAPTSPPGRNASALALSPDGKWLATASEKALIVWSTSLRKETGRFPVKTQRFWWEGPQSLVAAVPGEAKRVRIDTSGHPDGTETIPMPANAWLEAVADHTWLIREGTQLTRWPGGSGEAAEVIEQNLTDGPMAISPAGTHAAAITASPWQLNLWDLRSSKSPKTFSLEDVGLTFFAADGKKLLTATSKEYQLFDVKSGRPGLSWPAALLSRNAGLAAFSPEGAFVVTLHEADTLRLGTMTSNKADFLAQPPEPLGLAALSVAHSANEIYVLGSHHRLFVWDVIAIREALQELGL